MDELLKIRTLVQVVEAGSFSAAARHTDISISAIARQIKALEEDLGVRLLNRTTRHQALTEAGVIFYDRARSILQQVERAKRDASSFQKEIKGVLRVTFASRPEHGHCPGAAAVSRAPSRIGGERTLSDERIDLVAMASTWPSGSGIWTIGRRRPTTDTDEPRRVRQSGIFRAKREPGQPGDWHHNCIVYTQTTTAAPGASSRGEDA